MSSGAALDAIFTRAPGDQRSIPWLRCATSGKNWLGGKMGTLVQDLKYGLRMLAKNPGFTAVAVVTLALGIGANTAIFSLTYAVILKSLPVPNPGQLVRYMFREEGVPDLSISGPAYEALCKHETVNRDLLAWSGVDLAVRENE